MGEKVDMSLDDIIANDRKSRGGSRGASRGGGGGRFISGRGGRGSSRGGQSPGRRTSFPPRGNNYGGNDRGYDARRSLPVTTSGPGKLLISNLDYGVSEGDLYELFSEFGNIKMAIVHYDRNGMSLGSAEVMFDRKSDAIKGLKQYNGVPLDGKPMRIEITGSERELVQNSYPAPYRQVGGGVGQRRGSTDRRGSSRGSGRGTGGRGRGSTGGRGGSSRGGAKKEAGVAPSKEKLDEEMDAYMSNKA